MREGTTQKHIIHYIQHTPLASTPQIRQTPEIMDKQNHINTGDMESNQKDKAVTVTKTKQSKVISAHKSTKQRAEATIEAQQQTKASPRAQTKPLQ